MLQLQAETSLPHPITEREKKDLCLCIRAVQVIGLFLARAISLTKLVIIAPTFAAT